MIFSRYILFIFILFSLNSNGQTYINKSYTTSRSKGDAIVRETQFFFYKDSSFFCLLPYHFTFGYYSLNNDTIQLTSLLKEQDIQRVNNFTLNFKGKEIYDEFGEFYKKNEINLTRTSFILRKDLLFLIKSDDNKLPSFLRAKNPSKKVKLDVNYNLPVQICNKSIIDTSDLIIVKQYYKKNIILYKTIDISKPFSVFDIDSSNIVISPINMSSYFSPDKQFLSSSDSVISFSLMFNFKKTPLAYYVTGWNRQILNIGYELSPVLDKLLTKKYTHDTYKKCTKQLLNSDYFHHKKVSFSDSLKINYNESKFNFNGILFGIGYVYLNELITDYNTFENYIKFKKNANIFISKPAFTKNKLFALIKVKGFNNNEEKYLLFERRIRKYQLIAAINEHEIKLINKSLLHFGQYHKSKKR